MSVVVPLLSGVATGYLAWLAEERHMMRGLIAACSAAGLSWQYGLPGCLASLAVTCTWLRLRLEGRSQGRVVCCKPEESMELAAKTRATIIAQIIQACPSLASPRYLPTLWAADTWANCGLFIAKQIYDKSCLRRDKYTREVLVLEDGGTVSIDYAECPEEILDTAPIVIFLHTITGSAKETGYFMRYAVRRGWRTCVFNRRGHAGLHLTSPSFNVMGESSDTAAQVESVRKRFPNSSYLAMVGISAGSGLLVTYLGKEGDRTPVQAAASLCPAYDITRAFSRLSMNYPSVDKHILGSMKRLFLKPNLAILNEKSPEALQDCSAATTIHEFLHAHWPFSGAASLEEYWAENNPMEWVDKVARPTLIVNAEDDMVCLAENIREDIVAALPGALLLRTQKGSHIAYNEGIFGTGNYLSRVTMDFLDAARAVSKGQAKKDL